MSANGEEIYRDGFIDGQEEIVDQILEIIDNSMENTHDTLMSIWDFVGSKKREIESL